MTVLDAPASLTTTDIERPRPRTQLLWFGLIAILVILLLAATLRAGADRGNPTVELTASRTVTGTHQASFWVHSDVGYGFTGDIPWYDARGEHEGTWPSCLPRLSVTREPIRFGVVQVSEPDGTGQPSHPVVVWVDCRH